MWSGSRREKKENIKWLEYEVKFMFSVKATLFQINFVREVFWNARKSMWKMIYSCDSFCPFFSKCPKIEEFHFRFLFCFKIDHVHFFRNARFSYHIRFALFLKCPIFPIWFWKKFQMKRSSKNWITLKDHYAQCMYSYFLCSARMSSQG